MKTMVTKMCDIKRKWYLIDAADKILGRVAAKAARLLNGKNKPLYQPNVDCGDNVVIINADKITVTGGKEIKKTYFKHTGYVGNQKNTTFKDLKEKSPETLIRLAVKGMLPKNRLSRSSIKKLKIYSGSEHPHNSQQPEEVKI